MHVTQDSAKDTSINKPVNLTSLCNEDISRYSRQLILPEIGPKGLL